MTAEYPEPAGDVRRTLGVRPGVQPGQRVPSIHLEDDESRYAPGSPATPAPPSPRTRVSTSLPPPITVPDLPPLRPPTSPLASKGLRRLTEARQKVPQGSTRGLYETQKLLAYLLERLEAREAAPDTLDRAAVRARGVSGISKGKGKGKVVRLGQTVAAVTQASLHTAPPVDANGPHGIASEDLVDEVELGEGDWNTDSTYDLVEQTRDLLALAERQELNLFDDTFIDLRSAGGPSQMKRKAGRLSSLASPSSPLRNRSSPDTASPLSPTVADNSDNITLLDRMLNLLESLFQADCLHRIHRFSLLRPPNALQAITLDIATYLYQKGDGEVQVRVMEMVIDGLYGMGEGMSEKLCAWIDPRLEEQLHRLATERGDARSAHSFRESFSDPFAGGNLPSRGSKNIPTFAFSAAGEREGSNDLLPPNGKPISPISPTFSISLPLSDIAGLLSTHSTSSHLPPALLRMAALIPRVLLAITSTIDLQASSLATVYRVHRLLSLLIVAKPDTSIDLLELIALGPPNCRRAALEILATFYPATMGHNAISRRLATFTYANHLAKWETGHDLALGEDDTESHHFIPWRISSRDGHAKLQTQCGICQTETRGFCVQCTLCHEVQHLSCYQSPDGIFRHNRSSLAPGNSVPRSDHVWIAFSKCLPTLTQRILDARGKLRDHELAIRPIGKHHLHLVNLFNLTLCQLCREPLWGTMGQAYACMSGCQGLFHPHCVGQLSRPENQSCRYGWDLALEGASSSRQASIHTSSLKASFENWAKTNGLQLDIDVTTRSYDEIAVSYGVLWTQYQLLKNGITSGALLLHSSQDASVETDPLQLRRKLRTYEDILIDLSQQASTAATDFAHVMGLEIPPGLNYIFSIPFLTYCTALLRAPPLQTRRVSEGLLSAENANLRDETDTGTVLAGTACESLNLNAVRLGLTEDVNIKENRIAVLLLNQLLALGLCSTPENTSLSANEFVDDQRSIFFTLPYLMDSSPTVELLVMAIEVLLAMYDLTANEQAFSLLVKRASPSLLCSSYALERLGHAVIGWIMAEEEDIHRIVEHYASKHRRLPGIRLKENQGGSSVSTYKGDRRLLLQRYAQPWLLELHNLDPNLYAHLIYEQCKAPPPEATSETPISGATASGIAGLALERMTHVVDTDVIFTALLDLLIAWLEDLGAVGGQDNIYRALPRLLKYHDTRTTSDSESNLWQLAANTSVDGSSAFDRVCRWMRVLSFSGVEIPWSVLINLVDLQASSKSAFQARLDLVIAVNANPTQIESTRFTALCSQMFVNLVDSDAFTRKPVDDIRLDLMRQSLSLLLRAYGVMFDDLAGTALDTPSLTEKQPASLSKRRRLTSSINLIDIDEPMILAVGRTLRTGAFPPELLLDFLWLLFTRATAVANVDGFLHRISDHLYPILWDLAALDINRRSRARVFLRLLAVDPITMERLAAAQFKHGDSLEARKRLLIFVLELADDSLTCENLSWRRASVGLVTLFLFKGLLDATSISPDKVVTLKTLQPAHLRAISTCFEEYLVQSSDEWRVALLLRLRQLRLALPSWTVLSWGVIDELLTEQAVTFAQLDPTKSSQTLSALVDVQAVRSNLIAIGLDMLASGLRIGYAQAQRFQQHTASVCAPPLAPPVDGVVNIVFPSLRAVLDSSTRLSVTLAQSSAARNKESVLVGSLFVPVAINLCRELNKHDLLAQRHLLDIYMVTIFKQALAPVELSVLNALQAVAEYVASARCSDNRLLGVQVLQTAMSRMEKGSLARTTPSLFAALAPVLIDGQTEHGDPSVPDQVRVLLNHMVHVFGRSGLFVELFQSSNSAVIARALQVLHNSEARPVNGSKAATMVETMLMDMTDIFKRDRTTIQQVLDSFATFTHVLETEFTDDAAQHVVFGSLINRSTKYMAELGISDFDPDSIIRSSGDFLRMTSATAAPTLVYQISTLLHLCLARFNVRYESAATILQVSDALATRETTENTIRTVLFEFAGSAIHGHQVTSQTLDTLLNFLVDSSGAENEQQARVMVESAPGCIAILLRAHPSLTDVSEAELMLSILQKAASILLIAENSQPGTLGHNLSKIPSEAASVRLDVFNSLLLAHLELDAHGAVSSLATFFPLVGRAMSLALRACGDYLSLEDAGGDGAEMLSLVFSGFRLVILDALSSNLQGELPRHLEDDAAEVLWMRIWPDWDRLVSLSLDPKCINGPLRAVVHSVLLDVILFLAAASAHILSRHSSDLASCLGGLVEQTDVPSSKMRKAMTTLGKAGSADGPIERGNLLVTVKADLRAAERLRALRAGARHPH